MSNRASQSSDRSLNESTALVKPAQESVEDLPEFAINSTHAEAELESVVAPDGVREMMGRKSMYYYLITRPRGLTAFSITFFRSCVLTAFETILPLFVERTFHWTASGAGSVFLATTVPSTLGVLIGKVLDCYPYKKVAVFAFVTSGVLLVLLRFADVDGSDNVQRKVPLGPQILLCGLLSVFGVTMQVINLVSFAEVPRVVKHLEVKHNLNDTDGSPGMGQAWALFVMAYAAGQFVGRLLCGSSNWSGQTLTLVIITFAMVLPVALFTDGSVFDRSSSSRKGSD